jgi:hypothetical protein
VGSIEEATQSTIPLSLAEYREAVRALPPPELKQIEAFIAYVSSAHSWYKHLPLIGTGLPFVFLVNPCAMMEDLPPRSRERRRYRPYVFQEQITHDDTMRTDQYRGMFGWLDYRSGSKDVAIPIPVRHESEKGVVEARLRRVPRQVVDACSVHLTAAIHPLTARKWVWRSVVRASADRLLRPLETGGPDQFDRIVDLCRDEGVRDEVDAELAELVRPERERQTREMVSAVMRLRELLWA